MICNTQRKTKAIRSERTKTSVYANNKTWFKKIHQSDCGCINKGILITVKGVSHSFPKY